MTAIVGMPRSQRRAAERLFATSPFANLDGRARGFSNPIEVDLGHRVLFSRVIVTRTSIYTSVENALDAIGR